MKKKWDARFAIFSILVLTTFCISCSHVQSGQSAKSSGATPIPTMNRILSTIHTYRDLSTLANEDPAKIDNSKLPITPVKDLHITVKAPPLDMDKYKLSVNGLVNTPLALSYQAILNYPAISEVVLLICPGLFVDNAKWTGVPVTTLLEEAGVQSEATQVIVHAMDGYELSFSIQDIEKEGVFLAYMVNGQILPREHGYPIRLVMKGRYGGNWVKWVNRLEIK